MYNIHSLNDKGLKWMILKQINNLCQILIFSKKNLQIKLHFPKEDTDAKSVF